jgi:nickel superoxide dismutase
MRQKTLFLAVMLIAALSARGALAHCEIPCGIYDDGLRITMIREHIDTIEKSMKTIVSLSAEGEKNYNQLVRWIGNKDEHADEIQHIVSQYFMTQRIKPVVSDDPAYGSYVAKLTLLHQLLIEAMKSKQTLEQEHIDSMRALLDSFEKLYFEKK